jgi:signal transduction histidine kinase
MEPDRRHQRLALICAGVLFAGLVVATPFEGMRFARIDPFIPVVDAILLFTDAITAVLLFSLFSVLRMRALLALASGYLYTALLTIPHALTFPGAFAPIGLLGAGLQTNAYLYVFWHLGLPASAIIYGLLIAKGPERQVWTQRPILVCVAATVFVATALSLIAIAGDRFLPVIMIDTVHSNGAWSVVAPGIITLEIVAIWVVWRKRSSVLDMWLMVALWAWLIEILMLCTTNYRFSLAWYAGRLYGVLAGSLVLGALLAQSTTLFARLVVSLIAQRRERESRFLSVDAALAIVSHEIRQPLSAIMLNSQAGLAEMGSLRPNLGELHAIFGDIVADGRRVSDIIGSLRAALKQGERQREKVDLGLLVDEVLDFLGMELRHRKVSVEVEMNPTSPAVFVNRMQVRQVLVNLVTNAIEAMDGATAGRLFVRARLDEKNVIVEVEDRGPGIDAGSADLIFGTFFTSKTTGTGLGLSLCRIVVEDHGGRLSTVPAHPHGAIFRFSLPVEQAAAS